MNNTRHFLLVGQSANPGPYQATIESFVGSGAVECRPARDLPAVLPGDYALILIDADRAGDAAMLVGHVLARQPGARVVVLAVALHWSEVRACFHAGAMRIIDPTFGPAELQSVVAQLAATSTANTPFAPPVPVPAAGLFNAERSLQERPKMRPLIMFVDNHIAFIDEWSDWLEEQGCRVYRAYDRWQAEKLLRTRYVHLAIVDIRLVDDTRESDISGLELAADADFSAIPKIILTKHPSTDMAREAMRARVGQLPPAVDFVSKEVDKHDKINKGKEPREILLAAIHKAMAEWVRVNPDLALDSAGVSLGGLLYDVEGAPPEEHVSELVEELRDLFRKLFYDYRRLLLGRRFAGRRGLVFLEVTASDGKNVERSFLVVCGTNDAVRRDAENGQRWAADLSGGWSSAHVAATMNYAAAAYRLASSLSDVTSLSAYYERHSAGALGDLVDQLFGRTLAALHQKDPGFSNDRLTAAYNAALRRRGLAPNRTALLDRGRKLADRAGELGLAQVNWSAERLSFRLDGVDRSVINPLPRLFDKDAPLLPPTTLGIIHGRLAAAGVLVDSQEQPQLIDFGRTGRGPLIEDYIALELSIRFDLLDGRPAARYRLEEWLLSAAPDDVPDAATLDTDGRKAAVIIGHIRRCAADHLGVDRLTYLTWLLVGAAVNLAGFDPSANHTRQELLPHLHCLLLTALVGEQLFAPRIIENPDAPLIALRHNQRNVVWIRGQPVELAATEYRLVDYLYQRRNEDCSYEDIARDVLDLVLPLINGQAKADHATRNHIQQVVSGLRDKIETESDQPDLLKNVRGVGYQLVSPD